MYYIYRIIRFNTIKTLEIIINNGGVVDSIFLDEISGEYKMRYGREFDLDMMKFNASVAKFLIENNM